MNFERIKANLNSISNNINMTKLPQEIRDTEIKKLIAEAIQIMEENEKERKELQKLAFELSSRL